MNIVYISMDLTDETLNPPYVCGKWAIIDGCNIVADGFSDEFKAIDYIREHISPEMANEFEMEFNNV